jgi:hypothetical protein
MKTSIPPVLIIFALVSFALDQNTQAVSPPPPGGYPNFTTAAGDHALQALTLGLGNTAIGTYSMFSVTTGSFNTAVGAGSLDLNSADSNTATGAAALLFNTTGNENTAIGTAALEFNDTAHQNTATGAFALFSHVSGNGNTATGWHALFSDTSGQVNTAVGASALASNTSGGFNTANGFAALSNNTVGGDNTAIGQGALQENIDGGENTALGLSALASNTTGDNNVALGFFAGFQQTTGSNNVYIGAQVEGTAGESNACYIGSIFGQTSASGVPVLINSNNKLGTVVSSRRFKDEIQPMDKASEALLGLKPVTFRYKKEIDPVGTLQFGLVAEDVGKVNPDFVVRDKEGKPYSVRYDQVNAMLLNEFLKEHRKNEEQEKTIAELRSGMTALAATVKEQAAQIQKVSAQLEVNKTAPQMVLNRQ